MLDKADIAKRRKSATLRLVNAAELSKALSVATDAARQAGELILDIRKSGDLDVHSKGKVGDLVTRADTEAERLIVRTLSEAYPDFGIVGEEGDRKQVDASSVWIIDPIDGTSNFAHGRSGFGVSIGLAHKGEGVVGAIYYPARGVLLSAVKGDGTKRNDIPVTVKREVPVALSMVDIDFPAGETRAGLMQDMFGALGSSIGHPRMEGAVVMGALGIIEGTLDAYVQPWCNNWDCAALDVILREAGALATTFSGESIDLRDPKTSVLAACDRALHESLLQLLVGNGVKN